VEGQAFGISLTTKVNNKVGWRLNPKVESEHNLRSKLLRAGSGPVIG